jgi:hypothetical protein
LQQTSHLMFGPSAVPVLAKIDRGGAHSQDNVTAHVLLARGILDCGLHTATALLTALIPSANSLRALSVMTAGNAGE